MKIFAIPALILLAATGASAAPNPAYQAFLFNVCGSTPTGALLARCAETPGSLGNVSTDSESSLNPNQTLTTADTGLAAARAADEQTRERIERVRAGEIPENALQVGPFSLLINANYASEQRDRDITSDSERGYDSESWGGQLGFDYRANPHWVVGLLVDWRASDLEFDQEIPGVNFVPQSDAGTNNADRLGFTAFGVVDTSENSLLQFSLGYMKADYSVTRRPIFQSSVRTIPQTDGYETANVDGADTFAGLHWEYLHDSGSWQVGPYVGFFYARSEVDSYREQDLTNSGLAMAVDDYDRDSELGFVGVRVSLGISLSSALLLPQLRVEYAHEFAGDAAHTSTAFLLDSSNTVYVLEGDDPDRDYAVVAAGVSFVLPNGWLPFIDYEQTLGCDDIDSWRITGGLRHEL